MKLSKEQIPVRCTIMRGGTSKFAMIGPPTRPDADIDYTFAQSGIEEACVGPAQPGNRLGIV